MASKKKTERKRSNEMKKKPTNDKKPLIAVIVLIGIIVVAAGVYLVLNQPSKNGSDTTNGDTVNPIAVIDTSEGTIKVELFQDKVPNTVDNFIDYVNDGYYNGLIFHRIANLITNQPETHIIQGGGFYPNGTRKETKEPIALEIHPDARHIDGAIAMARTTDPNSATSQFYICDGTQSFLDDNYAVFGMVIDGMDIVRSIALVETTTKNGMTNWPIQDVIINSITIQQ